MKLDFLLTWNMLVLNGKQYLGALEIQGYKAWSDENMFSKTSQWERSSSKSSMFQSSLYSIWIRILKNIPEFNNKKGRRDQLIVQITVMCYSIQVLKTWI